MIFDVSESQLTLFGHTFQNLDKILTGDRSNYISSILPPLDLATATTQLQNFRNNVITGTQSFDDFFSGTMATNTVLRDYVTNTDASVLSAQSLVEATNAMRESQIAQNRAIDQTSLNAKVASIAMKGLAMVGEGVASWLVSTAISFAANKINDYLHKTEIRAERVAAALNKYDEASKTIRENSNTLNDLSSEFNYLSQYVDEDGNNLGLSIEQYKRYKEILEQIIEISPDLVKGYTAENEAIMTRNTALMDALETQNQLKKKAEEEYLETGEDLLDNYYVEATDTSRGVDKGLFTLRNTIFSHLSPEYLHENSEINTTDLFKNIFKDMDGIDFNDYDGFSISSSQSLIDNEEEIIRRLQKSGKISAQEISKIRSLINDLGPLNKEVDNADRKLAQYLGRWASTDFNADWYEKIDSSFIDEFESSLINIFRGKNLGLEEIEAETKKLGEDFSNLGPQFLVPVENIKELVKNYKTANISDIEFGESLKKQTGILENYANSIDKNGNKPLAEFIRNITDSYNALDVQVNDMGIKDYTDFKLDAVNGNMNQMEKDAKNAASQISHYNELISRIRNGNSLAGDEIYSLSKTDPSILKNLEKTSDGYTIQIEAIEALKEASINTSKEQIERSYKATKQILLDTKIRLEAYKAELQGQKATIINPLARSHPPINKQKNSKQSTDWKIFDSFTANIIGTDKRIREEKETDNQIDIVNKQLLELDSQYTSLQYLYDDYIPNGLNSTTKDLNVTSAATNNFSESIDFAAHSISLLNDQISLLDGELNDGTLSYDKKIELIDKLINKQKELTEAYDKTQSNYQQEWQEAAFKIPEEYVKDIISGKQFDKKQFTNENLYNLITDAIEKYKSLNENGISQSEAEKKVQTYKYEKFKLYKQSVDDKVNQNGYNKSDIQNLIDEQSIWGDGATEEQLEKLIKLAKKEQQYYIDLRKRAIEELASIPPDSIGNEKYNELQQTIQECEDAISGAAKEQEEWNQEILEMPIKEVDRLISILENDRQDIENSISESESKGIAATAKQYANLIALSKQEQDQYREKLQLLEDSLSYYEEGSDKYTETLSKIQECENAISNCTVEQNEWNKAILQIPITKLDETLGVLGRQKQDIQNGLNQLESLNLEGSEEQYQKLIDVSKTEQSYYAKKLDLLKRSLKFTKEGSRQYYELMEQIQECENAISDCITDQNKWNETLLSLPIRYLEKANEELQKSLDKLNEQKESYDTVISAVVETIDRQIDKINEEREATQTAYEEKIDFIGKEIEALEKTNEEREHQLALEQAQYDLERARNQKTVKILRDGEFVYEANQDDIRDAQDNYDSVIYDQVIKEKQDQIEALEKEREEVFKKYDEQVEALDKVKEKWSEIASELEYIKNMQLAESILGSGWQDRVLGGDTADFSNLSTLYEKMAESQTQLQDQVKINEDLIKQIQNYIEEWQKGKITIQDAQTAIEGITTNIQPELDAALKRIKAVLDYGNQWSYTKDSVLTDLSEIEKLMTNTEKELSANKDRINSAKEYANVWTLVSQSITGDLEVLNNKLYETKRELQEIYSKTDSGKTSNPPAGDLPKYHIGIEKGLVSLKGAEPTDRSRESALARLSLTKLELGEVPLIAKAGEAVLTKAQQETLLENFTRNSPAALLRPLLKSPVLNAAQSQKPDTKIEITMGDINLPNVKDTNDFAKGIVNGLFRQALTQELNRRQQ